MALKIFVVTAGEGVELEPIVATYTEEDAAKIRNDFETDGLNSKVYSVGLINGSDTLKFRKVYLQKNINGEKKNDE